GGTAVSGGCGRNPAPVRARLGHRIRGAPRHSRVTAQFFRRRRYRAAHGVLVPGANPLAPAVARTTAAASSWESGIGNRESGIGNRESGKASRTCPSKRAWGLLPAPERSRLPPLLQWGGSQRPGSAMAPHHGEGTHGPLAQ